VLTAGLRGRTSLHLRLGRVGAVITCGVIHVMGADARIHTGHERTIGYLRPVHHEAIQKHLVIGVFISATVVIDLFVASHPESAGRDFAHVRIAYGLTASG